jgi:hypothetical protein
MNPDGSTATSARSKIMRVLRQPYTISLIAAALATIATVPVTKRFFFKQPAVDSGHSEAQKVGDRIEIGFLVRDEIGRPISGAEITSVGYASTATTDSAGISILRVNKEHPDLYIIEARGYRATDMTVQASELDRNIEVVLRPEHQSIETGNADTQTESSEPYVQVFRSGPREGGTGSGFSPWYRIDAAAPKPGYVIDEKSVQYSLSGDRSCNSWSECRIETQPTAATFTFRMQGHSEWFPPHSAISEGVLVVRYVPAQSSIQQ